MSLPSPPLSKPKELNMDAQVISGTLQLCITAIALLLGIIAVLAIIEGRDNKRRKP
jgi:hypothetical protein